MPFLKPVEDSVAQAAAESDAERLARFRRAWEHYYGTNPLPLQVGSDGVDDNVRLGFASGIVDRTTSLLLGVDGGLTFDIEGREGLDSRLDELWVPEQRALVGHKLAINGGVTGHAIVKLTSSGRVIVVDPSDFEVDWDDEDLERVLEYRIVWTTIDRLTGKPTVRRQRTFPDGAGWLIVDERSVEGDVWEVIGEERWPWEWPPIIDSQNLPAPNEYWGRADLENDVLDLIDALERVASNVNRINRLLGHPIPYVVGESAKNLSQINVSLGRLLAIPNKDAKVGQLEMVRELAGAVQLYVKLREALHEVARDPEVATGKLEHVGQLSGFALQILYRPLIEKTGTKRLLYGPMLARIAERLLLLAGANPKRVSVVWPDLLPSNPKEEVEVLEADRRMKVVSRQTVAEKRGYDWDVEQERLGEERESLGSTVLEQFDRGGTPDNPVLPQAEEDE